MKLYDCATAPSPRRVRMFIAEKGIEIPVVQVDLRKGEQLTPEFKLKNPRCTVPVLELDDGIFLCESLAICHYLEQLHQQPALLGTSAVERAQVLQWTLHIECDGFQAVAEAFRNSAKGLRGRALSGSESFEQLAELAERGRRRTQLFFAGLDAHLAEHPWIATGELTFADITALTVVDFAGWIKMPIPDDHAHLRRWYEEISARPSAKA